MQHSAHHPYDRAKQGADMGNLSADLHLPAWLPNAFKLYLSHTEEGQSIRALARAGGMHASTVLRHVRRCEMRRDDPLIDEALSRFETTQTQAAPHAIEVPMKHSPIPPVLDEAAIHAAVPRLLRRLAETGAFLAIAPQMEKAAVMRALPDGRLMRMAVVDRPLAQVFALKEWIALREGKGAGKTGGKVDTYEITAAGRAELKARLAAPRPGMAEAPLRFAGAEEGEDWHSAEAGGRRARYNLAESPVAVLGRRREKDGSPYLHPDFVRAAERLREDFELAQMGASATQDWDIYLTGDARGQTAAKAPQGARARVAAALTDLGPDLGHIALRVCCHLEGVEEAEQRLGWAARSGKVVLRIALRRLARHYDEVYGKSGPLIG